MNITLQNISKAYNGSDIFNDFSLDIVDGTRLCVCGSNGTGKSTLLKIIAGAESADAGKVLLAKNCRLGYVEQISSEDILSIPLLTWVQNVLPDWQDFWQEWEENHNSPNQLQKLMHKQHELEAKYGYNPEQHAQTILSGLGFTSDKWLMPIGRLSGGWRERAKLARVLVAGADILLLDEPTNHLDLEAVEWLENFLLNYKGALVFVAHDKIFMDNVSSHILYLGGSKPIFRKSNFSNFILLQEKVEQEREATAKKISEEIDRKMDFVRRFGAKATKARQASSRQKMAKKLEKELSILQPEQKRKELNFKFPKAPESEKVVLSIEDLSFAFNDGHALFNKLNFSVYKGDRIGIVGHNGCGKSTLLKIIANKLNKSSGIINMGSQVRIGYFSQHQNEILTLTNGVLFELRRLSDPKLSEEELMSVLGLFMLGHSYFERQISTLSGGERARLVLAILFLSRCNFLILDEPSNHLDLESREALIDALDEFDATILMVAHDRHLLREVVDIVWQIDETGLKVFEEGYDEWDIYRKQAKAEQAFGSKPKSREELNKIKREEANLRNTLHKKLKPLQDNYSKLEKELEDKLNQQYMFEQTLADEQTLKDTNYIEQVLKDYQACKVRSEVVVNLLETLELEIQKIQDEHSVAKG